MISPGPVGVNLYPDYPDYIVQPGNNPSAFTLDQNYLLTLPNIPERNANGMYVCDDLDNRRGPYFNPQANHSTPFSPYHSESKLCGTCHDVSNPAFSAVRNASNEIIGYVPNDFNTPAPDFNQYEMFPVERTYSEWTMSEYNTPGGVTGTYFGGNKAFVSTCQDCHMRDVTGKGCNKNYAPVRNDLPLHDMTGGNTFVPDLINLTYPGEADLPALAAGKLRARDMLQHAASLEVTVDQMDAEVTVKITNETGHKLPSGYPEGRRIWINLKAFNSLTAETFESGYYDLSTGVLDKTDTKIYQVKPGFSPGIASALGLIPGPSFHFVLSDTIYSDNRIPPRGFTNANFTAIQSPPVGYSYEDGQYWDETMYQVPFVPDSVDVTLFYQTTSKEYIEFLRDENYTNNAGQFIYDLWDQNGKSAPEVMNRTTWSGPPVVASLEVDLKVYLEGPFNGIGMNTFLNSKNSIPTNQPYNLAPWNYSGTESVVNIPNVNVVDWILLELRETGGTAADATSSTIVGQKAAFLLNNGNIVDTDGISFPRFDLVISDNLYAVIWHRNHIGIMTAYPLVNTSGVYSYDYSLSMDQVYGGILAHKEITTGIWGMVAADADANGIIDFNDKSNNWMLQAGLSGYLSSDFNLDYHVNNLDKNDFWLLNQYAQEQVPDNFKTSSKCFVPN
jgi:hypothetical protein